MAAAPPSEICSPTSAPEPGLRHALELRVVSRSTDLVQLDWWYDTRGFDPHTVEELAEQLPLALIELTSEALRRCRAPRLAVGH